MPWRQISFGIAAIVVGFLAAWAFLQSQRQSPARPPDFGGTPGQQAVDRANWYFDQHRWAEAIENYRSALREGLDNADMRTDLGSALRFENHFAEAAAEYSKAQELNPSHENSLFDLAALYLQSLREPRRAQELLESFKAKFPRSGAIPRVNELLAQATREKSESNLPSASQ